MSITDRSRERVTRALSRLEADYGPFETVEDEWQVPPAEYRRTRERFAAGTVGGAGAWVRDDHGAVLLIRECGDDAWSEPAGKHEPGESLEETARREVREETGIDCRLTGVELAQVVTLSAPGEPPLVRLIVTFAGEYVGGTPTPEEGEVDAVRWWNEPPPALSYDALERLPIPATRE